jgi:hypothetical protein
MKEWHFFDKVYRRWLVLQIGPLEKLKAELEASKYQHMDFIIDAKGYTLELNSENSDQNCMIVWLREYEAATLVHELAHLVMMYFDQVGVPVSRDNTEAFAFYQEYWWNEIQRARRKYPNGKSPKEAKR